MVPTVDTPEGRLMAARFRLAQYLRGVGAGDRQVAVALACCSSTEIVRRWASSSPRALRPGSETPSERQAAVLEEILGVPAVWWEAGRGERPKRRR